MASILFTYRRRVDVQPTFSFRIEDSDFYINTHGLSVTDSTKAVSPDTDNFVYIMNKQTTPVYVSGVSLSSLTFRNRDGELNTSLKVTLDSITEDDDYQYQTYNVYFRSNLIGNLILKTEIKYKNGSDKTLYPFQSYKIGARYIVRNVNNLNYQYYGKTKLAPNKKNGIIDINCKINIYTDSGLTTLLTNDLTFSVNLINTSTNTSFLTA
jgi:hypothetical protein